MPGVPMVAGEVPDRAGLGAGAEAVARQPRGLRPGRPHGRQPLKRLGAGRQLEGLVEDGGRAGVATSRPEPPQRNERHDPADGCDVRAFRERSRGIAGLHPPPLVQARQ
jgi:hypothetical protein